ncbi:hypothetical protein MMSR116_07060 [Methylobacterium mesophilicum SR1.6/6]|uniref:Uncharacterized protein n=1 Tax=Methylobacterium mesophilicum SR1.6/6 TaxID=908290 RepID=A0A6B9FFI8_9HYPH|nr:hypothetical protein MMSR116_07060 [Methylobacterium mesophilicum SR1.6/6]
MGERAVRKAERLKRLWPGWTKAALPPAPRIPREADREEMLPSRGLTASELIAMARQARAVEHERDPANAADVS